VIENKQKNVATKGALKERPLPRLLQQLFRKNVTGYFILIDETRDESEVYLRDGMPVHVSRPVDTDRLDHLLVEFGIVSAEIVAQAGTQITEGMRLGDVLEKMGYLDKHALTYLLKTQMIRKLTRLFFIADGTYSVYLEDHAFGVGAEQLQMQLDPRQVYYPGIRAAYDLTRVTKELTRLSGQEFRLQDVPASSFARMGIPPEDPTVEILRKSYLTLDMLEAKNHRPFEARSVVLSLYYADLLDRRPIGSAGTGEPVHSLRDSLLDGNVPHHIVDAAAFHVSSPKVTPTIPTSPAKSESFPPPVQSTAMPPPLPNSILEKRPPGALKKTIQVAPLPEVTLPQFIPDAAAPLPQPPSVPALKKAPVVSAPVDAAQRDSLLELVARLDSLSHFELLGVAESASAGDVGMAFVRAARQFHPDKLLGMGLQDFIPQAERVLSRMSEAAMVLSDPNRRAEYIASQKRGGDESQANVPSLLEAENYFLKGEVFLKKGDYAKAIEFFTLAEKGNSAEPQYKAHLAWAQFEDPQARKAVLVRDTLQVIQSVLVERPKFARGFYWVGLLWKFLNESEKASHAFRTAVELDASFIEAGRELRLIEMRKGKKTPAKVGTPPEPPRGGFMSRLFKK
jgi:hypothetical protein